MKTIGIFNSSMIIEIYTPARVKRGTDFLNKHGFEIIKGELTFNDTEIYRSGTIKERALEFNGFLKSEQIDILMPSIGGLNSNAILPYIDYEFLKQNPKLITCYSDTTAILNAIVSQTEIPTLLGYALSSSFGEIGYFFEETYLKLNKVFKTKTYELVPSSYTTAEYVDWNEQQKKSKKKKMKLN